MKNNFWIVIISILLFLPGCELLRRNKNLAPENLKSLKQFEKLYTEVLAEGEYDWMSASGKVKIKSKSQNISLSTQLKSRNDSLVWARLAKLLEVARAQADVNHFQLINRLDRTFIDYSFEELSSIIDPKEGLQAFQNLLMGNIPFNIKGAEFTIQDASYTILQQGDSIVQRAVINKNNLKLSEYYIASTKGKTQARVMLTNYTKTEYGWVPQKLVIKISGNDIEEIQLDFSKIEFKKREKVEFEIPTGYKEN